MSMIKLKKMDVNDSLGVSINGLPTTVKTHDKASSNEHLIGVTVFRQEQQQTSNNNQNIIPQHCSFPENTETKN